MIGFCVDCKHMNRKGFDRFLEPEVRDCLHPEALVHGDISPITGKRSAPRRKICMTMRAPGDLCGTSGALFEPRKG